MTNITQISIDCIDANPDIAGIGVRVSVYAQNILALIVAFSTLTDVKLTQKEERTVAAQSSAILLTSTALMFSAIIQAKTYGMSTYHAIIILNLGLMNSLNTMIHLMPASLFANMQKFSEKGPTSLEAQLTHSTQVIDCTQPPIPSGNPPLPKLESSKASDPHPLSEPSDIGPASQHPLSKLPSSQRRLSVAFSPLAFGSIHLTMVAAFGLWFWATVDIFGSKAQCEPRLPLPFYIVGYETAVTIQALRIASLTIYSLLAFPFLNIIGMCMLIMLVFIVMALVVCVVLLGVIVAAITLTIAFIIVIFGVLACLRLANAVISSMRRQTSEPAPSEPESQTANSSLRFKFPGFSPPSEGTLSERTSQSCICLVVITCIELVILIDTELMVRKIKPFVKSGESQWTFGQTLAIFLLAIPLMEFLRVLKEILSTAYQEELRILRLGEDGIAQRSKENVPDNRDLASFGSLPGLLLPTYRIVYPRWNKFSTWIMG